MSLLYEPLNPGLNTTELKTFKGQNLFLQVLLAITLFGAYFLVPAGADDLVIWTSLAIFYVHAIAALRYPLTIGTNRTFIRIDVLFNIFYFILFYFPYQVYVLGLGSLTESVFLTKTFADQSNHALIISNLGLVVFYIGIQITRPPRYARLSDAALNATEVSYRNMPTTVFLGMVGLIGIYTLAGWRSAGEGRYTGTTSGGSLAEGTFLIITMLAMVSVALFVARLVQKRPVGLVVWLSVIVSAYWALRILSFGDRNSFLLIAIASVGGALNYLVKANRTVLFAMLAVALIFYNAIEVYRMSDDMPLDQAISTVFGGHGGETSNLADSSFNITTTTLRATLAVIPSTFDYGYGLYKFVGLVGIVPMIRGFVVGNADYFLTSADVITYAVLGPNAGWGVGSNILSDIYADFGLVGIPIFMLLLGLLCGFIERQAQRNPKSEFAIAVYLVSLALFAEMPRYSLDFPVRMLVWTGLLFFGYQVLSPGWRAKARQRRRDATS